MHEGAYSNTIIVIYTVILYVYKTLYCLHICVPPSSIIEHTYFSLNRLFFSKIVQTEHTTFNKKVNLLIALNFKLRCKVNIKSVFYETKLACCTYTMDLHQILSNELLINKSIF